MNRILHTNVFRKKQSGVAAIEFALIATLMILMLLGMFVYWRALQAQQSVARATGDGARLVQNLIYGALPGYEITAPDTIKAAATEVVKQSLQNSGIPGNPEQDTTVTLTVGTNEARLNVTYRLPPLFGNAEGQSQPLQFGNWALTEPANLQASSTVSFTLGTGG